MSSGSVERIAHYRILRRVGRGGMGIVYQAVDERDGRVVALKVIRGAESAADESAPHVNEARERFTREAEILKGLLHVNIVSFYEIGEEDGTPWLAMEFLDGSPLGTFAGRPWTETVPLMIQACHGMEYLATRGIVHRDLSPDNIFVVEANGERIVKLLDFGIAKLFEAPSGLESLTATGFFLGKVAYGSPEQLGSLGHGAPLDWRSDVYSLAVIFYQVLADRRPFEGKAPVEYIAAHLNIPAPPVAAPPGAPPLPMGLVRVIGQMLEKSRDDRPRSYREVIDRMVAVLREEPHASRSVMPDARGGDAGPTRPTSLLASASSTKTRSRLARSLPPPAARAALGIVLLAGALTFLIWRGVPSPRPRATGTPSRPAATAVVTARPVSPAAAGALEIVTLPYSEVLGVKGLDTRRSVAVPRGATTPLLLADLSAGTYRVTLRCPEAARTVERDVTVGGGAPARLHETFVPEEKLMESLQ